MRTPSSRHQLPSVTSFHTTDLGFQEGIILYDPSAGPQAALFEPWAAPLHLPKRKNIIVRTEILGLGKENPGALAPESQS